MMCLLSSVPLKDSGSLSTNTCVTAYSEHLQLSGIPLSEAAHVDHTLHTNAKKKGQAQVFCFFSTSNTESGKFDRSSVHERLTLWAEKQVRNHMHPKYRGTFGSLNSLYYSHIVISDPGARTLLLLINIYAFSLSVLGTENPLLLAHSLCPKLYCTRLSWEMQLQAAGFCWGDWCVQVGM